MANAFETLTKWQAAGLIDEATAEKIRDYEAKQAKPAGLKWQGIVALILGAILLVCGVFLFISAHWDELGPWSRFTLVVLIVALFHLAGAATREKNPILSTALHAIGTLSVGGAIALVGQIFNIEEHWPAAVLMWALAAVAGWALLRDDAQQTIALLLVPAWMLSELDYQMESHIGLQVYTGRFLLMWAVLYLTLFIGSASKVLRGILAAAAAIASLIGIVFMLEFWHSWSDSTFIPLSTRIWAWIALAALPLFVSLFNRKKAMIPVFVALGFALILPWCYGNGLSKGDAEFGHFYYPIPNVVAHLLVSGFTLFIVWWGMRHGSKLRINLGVVGFAITVFWFYFSNLFDKLGRSLGLIGLGVLFLAGGWALEKARRRLIADVKTKSFATEGGAE